MEWPASGIVTVLKNMPVNVRIVVEEGQRGFTIEAVE